MWAGSVTGWIMYIPYGCCNQGGGIGGGMFLQNTICHWAVWLVFTYRITFETIEFTLASANKSWNHNYYCKNYSWIVQTTTIHTVCHVHYVHAKIDLQFNAKQHRDQLRGKVFLRNNHVHIGPQIKKLLKFQCSKCSQPTLCRVSVHEEEFTPLRCCGETRSVNNQPLECKHNQPLECKHSNSVPKALADSTARM